MLLKCRSVVKYSNQKLKKCKLVSLCNAKLKKCKLVSNKMEQNAF